MDYGSGATLDDPSDFAIDEVRLALLEDYGIDIDDLEFVADLYRRDLQRFDRGVDGQLKLIDERQYLLRRVDFLHGLIDNRATHLGRAVQRIARTRARQIVIFLDNVDQRDHNDQNRVFLTANELAQSWDATVFVTLRPETYHESQRYGALSGYHPRVFSISPPRTDVMLQKRIAFALRVLKDGGDVRTASGGLTLESENLELFLTVLEYNFRRNSPLIALIDNLAGGNMRRALSFVTQFIGSGHIDTEKIVGAERREPGSYLIPLHEFFRSVAYGDNEHYDPLTSPVANLFAIDRPSAHCHFLLSITLHYVLSRGEVADSSGYVAINDIFGQLQGLSYTPDEVIFSLGYLARFRLIEAPLSDFDLATVDRIRVTTVGAYTLTKLPTLFTYCDTVLVDTPILDSDVRAQVHVCYSIADRVARTRLFREYLDACWVESDLHNPGWDWSAVSASLEINISEVERRSLRLRK